MNPDEQKLIYDNHQSLTPNLDVLSADEVIISLESCDISIDNTGNLCPYNVRNNFKVSKTQLERYYLIMK